MREIYQSGFLVQKKEKEDDGLGGWIEQWEDVLEFEAVLDMLTNDIRKMGKEVENSTHILMLDSADMPVILDAISPLDSEVGMWGARTYDQINYSEVKQSRRIVYRNRIYQIEHVDIPVNLPHHVEIYLKHEGDLDEA